MIHLLHVLHRFYEEGGTELAPMSTTEDIEVALHYSMSQVPLLFRFEVLQMAKGSASGGHGGASGGASDANWRARGYAHRTSQMP